MIDPQKLKNEFVVSGQGTVAEWNTELAQVDALAAAFRRRILLIRCSALAVLVAFAIPVALGTAGGVPFVVPGIFVPISILIYAAVAARKKVIAERVSFLRQILSLLHEDAGDRGRFKILLHLRNQREKVSEGPNPHGHSGTQVLLKDTWLTLNGRLRDGTSISESVVDLIRKRTKKNSRGKIKTKERQICLVRIQLAYNPATYGNCSVIARRFRNPFRLPTKAAMKAWKFDNAKLTTKTIVKGNVTADDLRAATQAVLLGVYRILNLSRRCVASTGGSK